MNKVIHHLPLRHWPLLLALSCCMACATTHRERAQEEVAEAQAAYNEVLESQFAGSRLSEEELQAFETRAQQKLRDFADYVKLLTDPSLDSTFRRQAIRQALTLFTDEEAHIATNSEQAVAVSTFLHSLQQDRKTGSPYIIQHIQQTGALQAGANHQYTGTLTFQQAQESTSVVERTADIIVKKVAKKFGNQEELVWEVFLAGIY